MDDTPSPASPAENKPSADKTRERILQAGFEEMYQHGYQGMRVDAILKKTGLAKGALYHHFPNKKALGYAVVDELLFAQCEALAQLLETAEDPIEANCQVLLQVCEQTTPEEVTLGCPSTTYHRKCQAWTKASKIACATFTATGRPPSLIHSSVASSKA